MNKKKFPAQIEALDEVLAFVEEMLESFECPMKVQTTICVAIEEVFVNVAHYAYGGKEGEAVVKYLLDQEKKMLSIRFEDSGTPYDPLGKADPDITLSAEDRAIGGLGIFMVKKSMDEVHYEYKDNKNCFTMVKKYDTL